MSRLPFVRIAAALCFSSAAFPALAGGPTVLTRAGAPGVYLVLDANPDARDIAATDDLLDIVERATGARIPHKPQPGLLPLYVGEAADFPSLPFTPPALAEEASLLKVAPGGIWVLGGSSLGTQHGVYTLLQRLGCRWIVPGDFGECLPDTRDMVIATDEHVESPDFSYRAVACGSNSPEGAERLRVWARRNRLYAPIVQQGHNLTNTLARLAPFEKRPDLYALLEGERKATQICTSNPEAVTLVIQSISEYLDGHPEIEAYPLCPDDNFYFCECANCRALDAGHLDRGGLPSVSDRYQVFLNQVLEGLAPTHPDVLVTTYAYNPNHTDPPQKTPVHPNTAVFCAPNLFCSIHGVGDTNCASQQDLYALLGEWRARSEHLYVYEYDPEPYCGGLPWPLWRAHAGAFPRYKALDLKGVLLTGQASWAPYFLSYYVAAQMLWDSGQDAEALYRDTLQAFFGAAAPDMARYYDTVASHFRQFKGTASWGMADYPTYFPQRVAKQAGEFLAAAEALDVPEPVRRRLAMVRLSQEMFDAYLGIRSGPYGAFADYKADLDRFEDAVAGLAALNEDLLNATYARARTGIALSEHFAREQGFVNQWLLCGPFDNLGMDGHDRVYPPETEIDLNATYPGKNGLTVGWRPNTTPPETAYLHFIDEYDLTDWVCAYALCWVTNSGPPKDVAFRVGSNDTVKVFLNGKQVWNSKRERVASVDNDYLPVTLPAGVSAILVKVGQAGYDWGLFFRITERDSTQVPEGISVSNAPPGTNGGGAQ